jgi:sterol desaturase/sphingolipid hydroxylase (fatty acid hydroxylase superfamily)
MAVFSHPLFMVMALVVGAALVLEALWLLITRGLGVNWSELAANLFIFWVGESARFGLRAVFIGAFFAVHAVAPVKLPMTAAVAVVCFLCVDCVQYWWHRAVHTNPFLWSMHSVHHTAATFALPLAGRLSWPLHLVDDFAVLPLALLGFDPVLIYLCLAGSFGVQYLAHAGGVGRLGPLEWMLNTPSHHRVHHHLEGDGMRRNYGAALIIWDRLFGTFLEAPGPQPTGVPGLPSSSNPFKIQFQGQLKWWRER